MTIVVSTLQTQEFELKEAHLKLLQQTYLIAVERGEGDHMVFMFPRVDTYRPYGNSAFLNEVKEAMGIETPITQLDPDTYQAIVDLHNEMFIAIEIRLQTNGELKPGLFMRTWAHGNWERKEVLDQQFREIMKGMSL